MRQGYLFKKSNKMMNRDWKKKYVTLCDDGNVVAIGGAHWFIYRPCGLAFALVGFTECLHVGFAPIHAQQCTVVSKEIKKA